MFHGCFPVLLLQQLHLVLELLVELTGVHRLAIDDLFNLSQLLRRLLFKQIKAIVHPIFGVVQPLIYK